ncbi:MAG: aldose epimerase family protein [Sulfitobacter sp.]
MPRCDPAACGRSADTIVIEVAGHDLAGATIYCIHLRNDGIQARVLSFGAILQDLRISGYDHPLVLGYEAVAPYLVDQNYFGATVGRVANRICDGVAHIDGTTHQLDRNTPQGHHIHGGSNGTGSRNWTVLDHSETHVVLQDHLPDGHMGYPGNLSVELRLELSGDQTLSVEITARTDKPTLCNFAHHSYFNLGKHPTIAGHRLAVRADDYVVVDDAGIPTGEVRPVAKTEFDLRSGVLLDDGSRYDHNFCLARRMGGLQHVASLTSPEGTLRMDIATTDTGLQVYTGHGITQTDVQQNHLRFAPLAGIALEPQSWPNAVNHADFPSTLLLPEQSYRQMSRFSFQGNPA